MIYTVTFNPAIDYVVRLDAALTPGMLNRSTGEACYFGGKGINVSNVLRVLGIPTTALGFIAGFTGEGLEKGLKEQGLNTDLIRLEQGMTRINVKVKGTQETEINGMGPVIDQKAMAQLYARLDTLTQNDILVLSGSIPGCLSADTYEKIMARLADKMVSIAVDATGALLLKALPYRPFLIKPNHHELAELFDMPAETDDQIIACARKLRDMGAQNVLVSMAGDGALLVDQQDNVHRIGCPKGKVVNSVGAGDSMVAGFLAGWLQTGDYSYALKLGTAAGSATAFSMGLAEKSLIDQLLESISL